MEAPKCRVCGLRHWGHCADLSLNLTRRLYASEEASPTVKIDTPAKPRRRKPAAVPVAPAAPAVVEPIGAKLRRLRHYRGESLQQAADAIGCTKPHLWELERGSSANPTLQLLRALASHYEVTVAQLIGEAP